MAGHDYTHNQTNPDDGRSSAVARVIEQIRSARVGGESLADTLIISAHPELMPDLARELEKLNRIEAAWAAAHPSGPTIEPVEPHTPIGPAEIDLARAIAADLDPPTIQVPGYQILREVGRGDQAVVYLAIKVNPGRRVALKVMRDGALADESTLARFIREAGILARLNHPNIVTILETGQTADGNHYFAMNYIAGCGLSEYMLHRQKKDADDPGKLLRLFLRICDAVNAAHREGVVHRDLKPGNIRVDERGEPHVLDFGLARTTIDRTGSEPVSVTGEFLGSLPWASPEQVGGNSGIIDARTDVYSLGVILYQMLTGGRFPYEVVGNVRDVLNNIVTSQPTPPSKVTSAGMAKESGKTRRTAKGARAVNEAMEGIVLKALAKQPLERYHNAGELGRAVADYLSGRRTTASDTRVSKDAKPRRLIGRISTHRIGVIAALLATLAGAIIWQAASREGDRMKPSRLLKSLVLFVSAGAWAAPRPAARPTPHRAPLAEHLARAEAHVHALDRHISVAAQHKTVHVTNAKLLERARRLSRHHLHEPWLWAEYLRHVPDTILIDTTFDTTVAQQDAETAAAALGDDLDALWARRRQMEAERLVLWSKIAFRAVADMELYNQPLYRFELKGPAGKPLDDQRMEALKAAVQFVRIVDHLAGQAQDAVETDPQGVYLQWHKRIAAGRKQMEDQMLLQALLALDVYKPDTDAGRVAGAAKDLAELSQTIIDSERSLTSAESADDDEEADASRAQLQQALADTVGAVASVDRAISNAATAWAVAGVPGTKVVVANLPDLGAAGLDETQIPPGPPQPSIPIAQIQTNHHAVVQVAFTPDGRRALSCGADGTISLWDLKTGAEIRQYPGHTAAPPGLAVPQTGSTFLASGGDDQTVRAWDLESGAELHQYKLGSYCAPVAIAPDGTRIIFAANMKGPFIAPTTTFKAMQFEKGEGIYAAAWSPGGRLFATGGWNHVIHVYDASTVNEIANIPQPDQIYSLAITPDDQKILAGDTNHHLRLFDIHSGRLLHQFDAGGARKIAVTPDSRYALAPNGESTLFFWDLETGGPSDRFVGQQNAATAVAISQDGRLVLSGGKDGIIRLWQLPPVQSTVASQAGRTVDLLKLFPDHHTVRSGKWEMTSDGLLCLKGGTLLFNYSPPNEYDIQLEFARRTGNENVAVNLPLSEGDVCFVAGGWANHFIGFTHFAKNGWHVLTDHNVPNALKNGVSASATIRVRRDTARAFFNGKLVAEIPASGKGLKIGKNEVDGKSVLGLRIDGLSTAIIYKMQLFEVAGQGQVVPMSGAAPATSHPALFDDQATAIPPEVAPSSTIATVMLIADFNRMFAASFPVSNNLATSGDAIASSDTHGVSPMQVFAGSRDGEDWHLADHSGFLEATWKHPPTGQYILLFGRPTAPGHDNWGTAKAIINKTDTVNIMNMSGGHMVLIDLGHPMAISSFRVEMNGQAYPGLCAIEIHATK